MKALLLAIQTSLRTITGPRDSDIFLSPDKDIILKGSQYPCIGIKDGKVDRVALMGGVTELKLPVEIYVYEKLVKDDHAILSVLDLTKSVHGKLKDNLLGGYVKDVTAGDETPIQLMYQADGLILRKTCFYEYEREEA